MLKNILMITISLMIVVCNSFALYGEDIELEYDNTPGWMVMSFINCAGTLISPRVVVSAARCTRSTDDWAVAQARTHDFISSISINNPGYDNNISHNISIIILDRKFSSDPEPIKIPSIPDENAFFQDHQGHSFVLYGTNNNNFYSASRQDSYVYEDNTTGSLIFYKSIYIVNENDTQFYRDNYKNLLYDTYNMNDEQINNSFIFTIPLDNENIALNSRDLGGTITYEDNDETYFVGIILMDQVHTRAKDYWNWILQETKKHSIADWRVIVQQIYPERLNLLNSHVSSYILN